MTSPKGLTTRRTKSGILVARVHYSVDPERDSQWATRERQKYSSQAAWDREQEIVREAGGGELVFAEILNRHADKIIIRTPNFQVPPFGSASRDSTTGKQILQPLWLPLSMRMALSTAYRSTTSPA